MKLSDFTPADTWRWIAACCIAISYAAFCFHKFLQFKADVASRHRSGPLHGSKNSAANEQVWIIYASQTGQAASIAQQTAQALAKDSRQIHLCRIEDNWQEKISSARYVLFVVSTYGEGSAPDHAARFARECIHGKSKAMLAGVGYGLLALGDSHYPHFCAFGRQLDQWLQACGARPQFERIEVDQLNAEALSSWQEHLTALGANEPLAGSTSAQRY